MSHHSSTSKLNDILIESSPIYLSHPKKGKVQKPIFSGTASPYKISLNFNFQVTFLIFSWPRPKGEVNSTSRYVCVSVCVSVCVCVCPQRVNVIRSQLQLNISQLLVIRTSRKFKQRFQGPSRTYPNHDQWHQHQSGMSSILQTSSNVIHLWECSWCL